MPRGLMQSLAFTTAVAGAAVQAPDMGITVTVTGVGTTTSGNFSGTFRLEGSNDGSNWFACGADIVIASGASPQLTSVVRNPFTFAQYRINCTAITGTGASLATTMACGA